MRTITRIALYAMPLLIAAACDTTEESYYLGPESDITISVEQKGAILLSADGTAQTIDVKATTYWDATIEESGNTFSVKQSVEKGDGTVTVEGQPNYNSGVKQGKLYLSARNINKRIEVDVMQAQLKFSMGKQDDITLPERGGSFMLEFESTVSWNFEVSRGDASWLTCNPGISGEGKWDRITVDVEVGPNYTPSERSVTLLLRPQNGDLIPYLGTLPDSFTVTQAAGTPPTGVRASVDSVKYHEGYLTVNYESVAPVQEVGVEVKVAGGETVGRYPAERVNNSYPLSGPVTVNVTGLDEGVRYTAVPYVTSMVSTVEGEQVEFTTDAVIVYRGVEIVSYKIRPTARQVFVTAELHSDVNVTEGGITIYNADGSHIVTYTKPINANVTSFEIESVDFMSPKTEYLIEIFVRTALNEAVTDRIPFTTEGLVPDEGNNTPPDGPNAN